MGKIDWNKIQKEHGLTDQEMVAELFEGSMNLVKFIMDRSGKTGATAVSKGIAADGSVMQLEVTVKQSENEHKTPSTVTLQ